MAPMVSEIPQTRLPQTRKLKPIRPGTDSPRTLRSSVSKGTIQARAPSWSEKAWESKAFTLQIRDSSTSLSVLLTNTHPTPSAISSSKMNLCEASKGVVRIQHTVCLPADTPYRYEAAPNAEVMQANH